MNGYIIIPEINLNDVSGKVTFNEGWHPFWERVKVSENYLQNCSPKTICLPASWGTVWNSQME